MWGLGPSKNQAIPEIFTVLSSENGATAIDTSYL